MATYDAPKARGRANETDPLAERPRGLSRKASRQELATGDGVKKVGVAVPHQKGETFMSHDNEAGNQVSVAANGKGTGTLKDPLNAYQRKVLGAVANPDGGRDRAATRKAAGRVAPNDRSRL